MSTLGVSISMASTSLNSIALAMSSLCSSPIAPPASASSTMVRSSSSLNSGVAFLPNVFFRNTLSPSKMIVRGVSMKMRTLTIGVRKSAVSSAYSLAMIFGDISPSVSMRRVTIMVAIVGPILAPHVTMPYTVATDVMTMLEIVLPTNTAVISLSKSSQSFSACAALLLSSAAIFFSLILFAELNAVSVAEKKVEQSVKMMIAIR